MLKLESGVQYIVHILIHARNFNLKKVLHELYTSIIGITYADLKEDYSKHIFQAFSI